MVINKLWPVIWVKDEYIRSIMKYLSSDNLCTKTVNNALIVLEEMVLKINSDQMNGKVGAIIHYRWRSDGIIYPVVFSSYELKKGNNVSKVQIDCV